ncbi:MAG: DUF4248 domain-containing protein [Akkermansia sp.]
MTPFEIKSYDHTQLALLYRPHLSSKNALRTFKNWMARTPGLLEALIATGYKPKQQRTLTPRQVALIVEYLGEP